MRFYSWQGTTRLSTVIMVKKFDMERIDKEQHWVIDIYKFGVIYSQQGYRGSEEGVAELAQKIENMTGCRTNYRLR